jgi:hypothetical protein
MAEGVNPGLVQSPTTLSCQDILPYPMRLVFTPLCNSVYPPCNSVLFFYYTEKHREMMTEKNSKLTF